MKLEDITNATIFTIDWAREDRQRMLKALSDAEPIGRNVRRSRNLAKQWPTWSFCIRVALARIQEKMHRELAARRRRHLELCEEIQRHGYLAGWRHMPTWSARGGNDEPHAIAEG